jgi:hypothetical protein
MSKMKVQTEEELLSAVEEAAKRGQTHCLVQFSAPWCERCPAFTEAVEQQTTKHKFEWLYAGLPEAEDLKEVYEIAKLPAIALLHCIDKKESNEAIQMPAALLVEQSVSPTRLNELLSKHCDHVPLAFDDDF